MLEEAVKVFRVSLGYCESLTQDIACEDFCKQPVAGMNHPAWVIGHLARSADKHATFLNAEPKLQDWWDTYGIGSVPSPDRSEYPTKDILLATWQDAAERYITAVEAAPPEQLSAPQDYVRPEQLPTLADFITFSLTAHTSIHLGQLSAWRRASGFDPLF